jgi:membrane-associated protease RseP (regulator of RpoE activity)
VLGPDPASLSATGARYIFVSPIRKWAQKVPIGILILFTFWAKLRVFDCCPSPTRAERAVMDTAWSLCVFKAGPGIRLGLSFHAAAERPTLSRVDSEGAASGSGLEPGDVIVEIDGQPVTSALAAASMLRGREGSIALEILRPAKATGGQGFASTSAEARAAVHIQAAWRGYDQRLAILFWDRTAISIQAAWRGTLTRWAVADWLNWHSVVSIQKVWQWQS